MTVLLVDALIALIKLTDRAFTAVENVLRVQSSPRTVDAGAPLAGAGAASAAAGPGEHPVRSTSELLHHAARELDYAYPAKLPAIIRDLQFELRDRAANLRACGD